MPVTREDQTLRPFATSSKGFQEKKYWIINMPVKNETTNSGI
jgi:hypothetical protein